METFITTVVTNINQNAAQAIVSPVVSSRPTRKVTHSHANKQFPRAYNSESSLELSLLYCFIIILFEQYKNSSSEIKLIYN